MKKIAIADVQVSDRIRHEFGDIDELAKDIRENGLIQPIVVDSENRLLCGERRLRACKSLGMTDIDAVVRDPADEHQALMMEIAENEHRKAFSFSERMAYAQRLEPLVQAMAHANKCGPVEERKSASPVDTRRVVAKEAGFGSPETYRKAKFVHNNGDDQMIQDLDAGKQSVDAAYRELKQKIESQQKQIEDQEETIRAYERSEDEMSEAYESLAQKLADVNRQLKVAQAAPDYKDRDAVVQNALEDAVRERDEAIQQRNEALDKLEKRVRQTGKVDRAMRAYLQLGQMMVELQGEIRDKAAAALEQLIVDVQQAVA